jgi:hypothetical protein
MNSKISKLINFFECVTETKEKKDAKSIHHDIMNLFSDNKHIMLQYSLVPNFTIHDIPILQQVLNTLCKDIQIKYFSSKDSIGNIIYTQNCKLLKLDRYNKQNLGQFMSVYKQISNSIMSLYNNEALLLFNVTMAYSIKLLILLVNNS